MVNKNTLATRKYNKKNRAKVRAYLRKTVKDRVERNRARRAAIKKHGKAALRGKDVHHPNGTKSKKTRIVKANHGPDKKKRRKK